MFFQEYTAIFTAIVIATLLAFVIFAASYALVLKYAYGEKVSAYECGFDPFSDTRAKFDVRFYIVSILFIIFDLEIVYLFPFVFSIGQIGLFGFGTMLFFLILLTIGFVYEWSKGALNWE